MANKKNNIKVARERTFSDLIGAPFYFLIQEFKPLARTILRFAGPWLAIALLGMTLFSNTLYNSFLSNTEPDETFVIYILLFVFFIMFGFLASVTATQSYISLYVKNGKGNFTIDDVGKLVKKNIVKVFFAGILIYIMVIIGVLFIYIPGIYIAIAMAFFTIIIVHEDASIGQSISRGFKIIRGHWWRTFGAIFIFTMITGTASYIFIIPIYAVIISAAISGTTVGAGSVIIIVLSVALYFVAYMFLISLQQILISFQYFNLVMKKESPDLLSRINAINNPPVEEEVKEEQIKETAKDEGDWEKLIEDNNFKKDTENTNVQNVEKEDASTKDNRFSDNKSENRFDNNNN